MVLLLQTATHMLDVLQLILLFLASRLDLTRCQVSAFRREWDETGQEKERENGETPCVQDAVISHALTEYLGRKVVCANSTTTGESPCRLFVFGLQDMDERLWSLHATRS